MINYFTMNPSQVVKNISIKTILKYHATGTCTTYKLNKYKVLGTFNIYIYILNNSTIQLGT